MKTDPDKIPRWILSFLRLHVEDLLAEADKRYEQRFKSMEKGFGDALAAAEKAVSTAMSAASLAVSKAEMATEKRFDSTNEFRALVNDMLAKLIPRTEADQRFGAIEQRLGKAEAMQVRVTGRDEGKSSTAAFLFAVTGLLIGAIGLAVAFFKH